MAKAKRKKKIVKPQYTTRAVRIKQAPKKPVPKELKIGLAVCGVVLVIAIILAIVLYNDGSLPMNADGVPEMEGNNWLIANKGSHDETKYYKVGEVNPMEGFTVDETSLDDLSMRMRVYYFNADDPDSQISQYYVTGTDRKANVNAETANTYYMVYDGSMDVSEVKTATINGTEVDFFTTATPLASEQTEETEPDADTPADANEAAEGEADKVPQQQLLAYIPAKHDTTIMVVVTLKLSEEQPALPDDALLEILGNIMDQIVIEP